MPGRRKVLASGVLVLGLLCSLASAQLSPESLERANALSASYRTPAERVARGVE